MRGSSRYCLLILMTAGPAIAQDAESPSLTERPRVPVDFLRKESPTLDAVSSSRTPRLQMFRMPSGFLANPLGLVSDDDPVSDDPAKTEDDLPFVQVTLGNHI